MTPVTISRDAEVDLDGILDYSIAAHGREVAEAYLRTIHAAFDRLSIFRSLVARGAIYRAVCESCPAADTGFSMSCRLRAC